ncbi:MAG: anti-sigma factor domain-containing protein [Aquihabitans sp.]
MTESDEFTDLLGAYALDAVDADERADIERHLAECPRCRAEVAEHREVASFLAHAGGEAPAGVWDKIAAELAPPAPPMRMAILPTGEGATVPAASLEETDASAAPVVSIERSGRRPSRPMLAVLAVAASIIVVLGLVVVAQSRRVSGDQTIEEMAADASTHSKLAVDLAGEGGSARAVVGADGKGYLIMDGVAAPSSGDVYQLWGKVDETVLSLGTFGDSTVVPFSVDPGRIGDIELFAVTQEKAPGVVASDQDPVMVGTV